MTATLISEPTTAELQVAARETAARYAALDAEWQGIDRQIDAAADRGDAVAVVQLEKRKRELPTLVPAAKAEADRTQTEWGAARGADDRASRRAAIDALRQRRERETRPALHAAVLAAVARARDDYDVLTLIAQGEEALAGTPDARRQVMHTENTGGTLQALAAVAFWVAADPAAAPPERRQLAVRTDPIDWWVLQLYDLFYRSAP